MTIKSKIAVGIASAAIFANMVPAAFAATTVDITGNGKKSNNTVNLTTAQNTTVTQNNTANINLNIKSKANTGGNKANGNTGGDVKVKTGDATSTVGVSVVGGVNAATVESCGCDEDTTIAVKNNGKKSDNTTNIVKAKNKTGDQTSNLDVTGDIKSKAKTGKNKANANTNGDVDVNTGTGVSEVGVEVETGSNVLEL